MPRATEQTFPDVSSAKTTAMQRMLSIEDAQRSLRNLLRRVEGSETISASDSMGRTLHKPVFSPIDVPPFKCSAIDGYALCGMQESRPGDRFKVIGESLAGHPFGEVLNLGEACRIFTGAAIPPGTTAVAPQENTILDKESIVLNENTRYGDNIRKSGSDISAGNRIADVGEYLSPFAVGWFAACGITEVEVVPKVRVAVFSTGDELREPGDELRAGQIFESNRTSISMLLKSKPTEIIDLGHLRDDENAIRNAIDQAANKADLILTSGGVSVGDADYVRPVLEELGALKFWNISLKPGKPLAVGQIRDCLFFGLPGNPVSTIVTYMLFVAPAIDGMSGLPWRKPTTFEATLSGEIEHRAGRREYQRGVFYSKDGVLQVMSTGDQSSNRLASFYQCNCLIEVPSHRDSLRQNEKVNILIFPGQHTFV